MEELMTFFQGGLEKDFGHSDDQVIDSLRECMEDLRRAGLDLPPPPMDDGERPMKPFGVFVPPTIDQMIGRRSVLAADGESHQDNALLIPADGGPAVGPVHSSAENRLSSVASSSILDKYETATDGLSSRRISVRDGRSSVTSLVDDFLDIEEGGGSDTQAVSDNMDYEVDNIDISGEMDGQQNWPWGGATLLPMPDSYGLPLPSVETNGKSDEARKYESRNAFTSASNIVSLNQPISVISVVNGESEQSTPTLDPLSTTTQRFVTTVNTGPQLFAPNRGDAMVREFFEPTSAPWQYMRVRDYLATSSSSEQGSVRKPDNNVPASQTWSSYAQSPHSRTPSRQTNEIVGAMGNTSSASINLRRREFFNNTFESGSISSRPLANGISLQAVRHYPIVLSPIGVSSSPSFPPNTLYGRPYNVSAPSIHGMSAERVSERSEYGTISSRPAVLNITSKVVSPTGRVVGSSVTYPNASLPSTSKQVYKSSISMQVSDKSVDMRYM